MPKVSLTEDTFLRILIYGQPGTGKTYTWLDMCRKMTNSNFYVIDVDSGVSETLRGFPIADRENMLSRLSYYLCNSWEDVKESFDIIKKEVKRNDWIVLEQLGQLWDMAQEYYIRKVFGTDLGEFYTQLRAQLVEQKKKGQESMAKLDGWRDWSIIKKLHNQDFMEIITKRINCKGLILTSAAKEIEDDPRFEEEDCIDIFSLYKFKPEGEKHNIYRVDAILYLTRDKNKGYWVKSPKVRGMPKFAEKIPEGQTAWDVYNAKRLKSIEEAGTHKIDSNQELAQMVKSTKEGENTSDDAIFG